MNSEPDAPGTIMQAQPRIVQGDLIEPQGDTVPAACMVVSGCYVEAPFNAKFIPATSFTLEAWVRPDWTADDPHAFRFVLDMREIAPATAGFGLCAKAVDGEPGVYAWRGIFGDGSTAFVILDSIEAPFKLKDPAAAAGTTHYLALAYDADGQTLTLFVNGAQNAQATSVAYALNMTPTAMDRRRRALRAAAAAACRDGWQPAVSARRRDPGRRHLQRRAQTH
jgi:hypothetical protein